MEQAGVERSFASGIDDEAVRRMIAHLQEGVTDLAPDDLRVPLANFTSASHAARERQLFRRLPLIAGFSTEIPAPGDFITRTVLDAQVLIVRQEDGSLKAHLNRCPHRGGKVELDGSGNKRVFVCRYHGWSFERDGALRAVPQESAHSHICEDQTKLIPVSVSEQYGFLWVRLDGDNATDVDTHLGEEAARQLAAFGLDDSRICFEKSFSLPINWKLVLDGFSDVLHPPFLHPDGVAKIIHSGSTVWLDYGRHGQLINARVKLLEKLKAGLEVANPRHYFSTNFILYPNSWVIGMPDHYEFWTVWPDPVDPARCRVELRFLVARQDQNERTDERLAKSWDILSKALLTEDWPMEEYIQANAALGAGPPFLYGRAELPSQHLHRQLRQDIGDAE